LCYNSPIKQRKEVFIVTLIEKLDNITINFYRTHNYYWPSDVVMTQQTMDELKKEIYCRGFINWNGKFFNHVSLRIFNDMKDGTFVASGANMRCAIFAAE